MAALDVLKREGPDQLSFRRVATLLRVSHTTVHRHCGSWEGLLDLCAEHLAAGLPPVDSRLPWATATEQRFLSLYEILAAHSALVILQRGKPWLGPTMMQRFSEPAFAASLATGMSVRDVIRAHRELYMFTVGCVLTSTTYDTKSGRKAVAALDPTDFPALATNINEFRDDPPDRETFLHGIRHLIAAWDPGGSQPAH